MGRTKKTNTQEEAYYMPFPKRLRELLDRPGETQGKLADVIGVNRQSIGQWKDGITTPDINSLNKIADYYGISADYLLGRTDAMSLEIDVRLIHDKTGLSDKSIDKIIKMYKQSEENSADIFTLNKLIEHYSIDTFLNMISSLREYHINKFAFIEAVDEYHKEVYSGMDENQIIQHFRNACQDNNESIEDSAQISIRLTPVEYYGYKMTELKEKLAHIIDEIICIDTKDIDLEPRKTKMKEDLRENSISIQTKNLGGTQNG